MIDKIISKAKELNVNIDSIYVEKDNVLDKTIINDIALHELRSCSKLLVAFAYGIAFDEMLQCKYSDEILSLDTKIYSTFRAVYNGFIPDQVKEWTIRTLLTHSTGYDKMMFNEKHLDTLDRSNLLEVLFNTEIKYKTGEHFTYSNVEPYLLSIFFQENFGISIDDYINDKIFKPLDIHNYKWLKLGNYCAGATGLTLYHSDFHKLGQLLMYRGRYNNIQVVPGHWIDEMTSSQIDCIDYYKPERVLPKLSAGYHIWISRDDIIFRDGSNGQYIICDHRNNCLITIMSSQKDMSLVTECLRDLI